MRVKHRSNQSQVEVHCARLVFVGDGRRVVHFAGAGGAGGFGCKADDVRIAGVKNRQCAYPEEASARCAELEVNAAVVMHAHFRQHRVVLNYRSPMQYSAHATIRFKVVCTM